MKSFRLYSLLTGSQIHDTIGLGTLKRQQEIFREKLCRGPSRVFDDEVSKRLKHGIDNEINGIATLVGKIAPVFFPGKCDSLFSNFTISKY